MASSRSTGTTFGVTGKKTGQLKPGKSSSETLLATKPQKLSRPSDKLNPKTVDPVSIVTMVIIASQTDQIRFFKNHYGGYVINECVHLYYIVFMINFHFTPLCCSLQPPTKVSQLLLQFI